MLKQVIITTVNQRILQFLAKYSDKEFHEREIARRVGVASGSANRALNELYLFGVVKQRPEWRMLFYSVDPSNPTIIEFKKLINILLLEPLVEELKNITKRIILYGSCAQGMDNSKSDMDIFIVTGNRDNVNRVIESFHFAKGFEEMGSDVNSVHQTSIHDANRPA
jgi:predicted nucleotidyltransferase